MSWLVHCWWWKWSPMTVLAGRDSAVETDPGSVVVGLMMFEESCSVLLTVEAEVPGRPSERTLPPCGPFG